MKELEMQHNLIKKLMELGYPESSIHREFVIKDGENTRLRVDIAITNPISTDIIAIFEIKSSQSRISKEKASEQVLKYSKLLLSDPLMYLYIQENNITKIYQVDGNIDKNKNYLEIENLPKFETLLVKSKIEIKQKSKKEIDGFKCTCYILAFFTLIFFILDVCSIYKFSTHQLSLIGVFICLLIMPYAAKLKFLGMEFERSDISNIEFKKQIYKK